MALTYHDSKEKIVKTYEVAFRLKSLDNLFWHDMSSNPIVFKHNNSLNLVGLCKLVCCSAKDTSVPCADES